MMTRLALRLSAFASLGGAAFAQRDLPADAIPPPDPAAQMATFILDENLEINLFAGDPEVDLAQIRVQLEGDYLGSKVAFEPVSDDEWTEIDMVRQGLSQEQPGGKLVDFTTGQPASFTEKKAA